MAEGGKLEALAELESEEQEAIARRDGAGREHQQSAHTLAAATALEERADKNLRETTARLAGALPLAEIEQQLERIATADLANGQANRKREESFQALIRAQRNRQAIAEREREAWTAYHSARNEVSELAPPAATDDLSDSWAELQKWAVQTIPEVAAKDDNLRGEVERLAGDIESRREDLTARFADQGVAFDDDPMTSLIESVTQANVALEEVRRKLEEQKRLRAEIKATHAKVGVADALARHLRADGFERWLLHEAFGRLASSASNLLMELSNGQYAFRHNERLEFEVMDHANAGEARSARTLSGGETFLASLSLALALADDVADFATEGTARLESIFLDEGFGTLDPDALDVVATAIEELGARGRMVGVVTHVADLAQRIPVQFKVSKASGSAAVERVET